MARKRVYREERRRRRRMPLWQKAICLGMAGVCLFAVYGVLRKTIRPMLLCWSERTEVRRLEARQENLKRENRDLNAKRIYLQSPQGAETEARKLGYVRPGEVSIVMPDDKPKQKSEK